MKSFVSLVPICSAALSRYDSVGDPVGNTGVIRSRRTVAGHGGLEISESMRYGDQPPQNSDLPPRQKASPGNSRFQGLGLSEFQGTPRPRSCSMVVEDSEHAPETEMGPLPKQGCGGSGCGRDSKCDWQRLIQNFLRQSRCSRMVWRQDRRFDRCCGWLRPGRYIHSGQRHLK